MKRVGGIVAFTAAVLATLAALTLLALEHSGTLERVLRDQLARQLGPAGEALRIGDASLRWFDAELRLSDVRLEAERGYLHLERVDVALQPSLLPSHAVRHVQVAGGRVVSAPALTRLLQSAVRRSDTRRPDAEHRPLLPPLRVRDLEVALHTPRAGELPLGSLDLVVEMDALRLFRASGVVRPAQAVAAPAAVHFSGSEDPKNRFRLRAATERLRLDAASPTFAARGDVRLDAEGTFHLDGSGPTSARARVSVSAGRVAPRALGAELPPLEGLAAELAVAFRSDGDVPVWHLPAWNATARVEGTWAETPLELWALAGEPAGGGVRAWLDAPAVALGEPASAALFRALGVERDVAALRPAGSPGLSAGAQLAWTGDGFGAPSLLLHLRPAGRTSITFHGWPSSLTGEPEGLPLPCEELSGAFVLAGEGLPLDFRAGIVDVRGRVGEAGSVRAHGSLRSARRPQEVVDLDLALSLAEVAIDDALRAGLQGLDATRSIWPEYGPRAGRVDSEWRLVRNASTLGLLPQGRVTVRDGVALWTAVPVPVDGVEGRLLFRWGARGTPFETPSGRPAYTRPFGVAYSLRGRTRTVDSVALSGFSRQEFAPGEGLARAAGAARPRPTAPRLHGVDVRIGALPLRGSDWEVLARVLPDMASSVEELRPSGTAAVAYQGWSAAPGRVRTTVEIEPQALVVHPERFPMWTEDVRGRVCVGLEAADEAEAGPAEPRVRATAVGRWTGGVQVAAYRGPPRAGRTRTVVYAAGVDPANAAFRGSVGEALAAATGERVDLSPLAVTGRVDARAELPLEPETPDAPAGTLRVHLRENDLTLRNFGLNALRGVLVLRDGVLRGERVQAVVGRTPVELRNAAFLASDRVDELAFADPMLGEPGLLPDAPVTVLQADLHARDLPLDREHLSGFLDPESLDALVDDAGLVGRLDLLGARCLLVGDGSGGSIVAVRGALLPHGVSLDAGVPVQVSSARVDLRRLQYEKGRLRAWGEIRDLYGRVAERELSRASCVIGYVDRRLTVQALDGAFEGGRIHSLGGPGAESAALHVDLAEPFRFDMAVAFEDVDVDGVLEGVFPSNVRDTGRIHAQLRLAGSLADPSGLVGSGSGFIRSARLWSIPVVRELFSQLGFDGTAVFDRMSCRFRLRDGVIAFPEIRARSPLLHLVGRDGSAGLDGRLDFDLEVRYSLIDKLGPINRLVYWIQNNLLRVSIRGDMARPRVVLRNALREVFGAPDLEAQKLPLPELTPLPDRF